MSQELSQHKACEEPKLFIQVMGKAHPEGHRFVFYDLEDQQEQAGLAEAVEVEDLPEPLSRIHGWACRVAGDRQRRRRTDTGAAVRKRGHHAMARARAAHRLSVSRGAARHTAGPVAIAGG